MIHPLPTIERGRVLVLQGEQGSGKTLTAVAIAKARGRYAEIDAAELGDRESVALRLWPAPATVIVDEVPDTPRVLLQLLAWVRTQTTELRLPYKTDTKVIRTPDFIICTARTAPLAQARDERFRVVNLGAN